MDLEGYKVLYVRDQNMILDSYRILLDKGVKEGDIFYESEEKLN